MRLVVWAIFHRWVLGIRGATLRQLLKRRLNSPDVSGVFHHRPTTKLECQYSEYNNLDKSGIINLLDTFITCNVSELRHGPSHSASLLPDACPELRYGLSNSEALQPDTCLSCNMTLLTV